MLWIICQIIHLFPESDQVNFIRELSMIFEYLSSNIMIFEFIENNFFFIPHDGECYFNGIIRNWIENGPIRLIQSWIILTVILIWGKVWKICSKAHKNTVQAGTIKECVCCWEKLLFKNRMHSIHGWADVVSMFYNLTVNEPSYNIAIQNILCIGGKHSTLVVTKGR